MPELQKDPMTRGQFIGMGLMGTVVGAILTIPPAAFLLGPIINVDVKGQTDVSDQWQPVGSVAEVPEDRPKDFTVEFPLQQTYDSQQAAKQYPDVPRGSGSAKLNNAVWVSWKAPIKNQGRYGNAGPAIGKPKKPEFLNHKSEGFTQAQIREIESSLNVLSNSCAHLGCPVRWVVNVDGEGEFLCPCHGGIYNINGDWVGGPPPRGMYRYVQTQVREDGKLYIKHGFNIKPGIPGLSKTEPYVI